MKKEIISSFKILFLIVVMTLSNSCRKEGLGGKATLIITAKHHNKIIKNHQTYPDTVFVKFNTRELLGTKPSDYDAYFVGKEGEQTIRCEGLKWGYYYLYATGMDSAGPYRVTGGLAYKIKQSDRKEEIAIDIAVTE